MIFWMWMLKSCLELSSIAGLYSQNMSHGDSLCAPSVEIGVWSWHDELK